MNYQVVGKHSPSLVKEYVKRQKQRMKLAQEQKQRMKLAQEHIQERRYSN